MEFRGLFATLEHINFRKQNRQQAALVEEIKSPHPRRMGEDFYQFVPNAFSTHDRDFGSFTTQSIPSRGLDLKAQNCSKTNATNEAKLILGESRIRIADAAQHLGLQIRLATDIVEHAFSHRIVEKPVDRKIPPLGIALRCREHDGIRMPTIDIGPIRAERGDLIFLTILEHDDNAELRSNSNRARK